ncbi:DUF6439 family protein [Phormidium sp. CCY1219]|uniref:DUF6439 family protein n=1 Tax=Phormidium sp. CCY1219 TaxID=2886104 RepID=UPI002D1F4066|nr:DUF6439 family protein [Phormidium sp. CCY1219]MEB3828012.1 DUF6439 family protein [Phormidium sp. CCY1219]
MANPTPTPPKTSSGLHSPTSAKLQEFSTLELAQALAERVTLMETDWHRLKSNRKVRATEQAATALVFLLKNNPEEALLRLQQATGWLDRSLSAPPCPTHGAPKEK